MQEIRIVNEALDGENLVSATLSEARSREGDGVRKVTVRPVVLRKTRLYQFEYQYAQKVQHRNLERAEAKALIQTLLTETFRQGYFYTATGTFQVSVSRAGKVSVHARPASPAACLPSAPPSHDRQKKYLLAEGEPIPFLVRLGVMTAEGKVVAAKRDKFKQINRFLEMVDDVAGSLPPTGALHVIDFGCGKAYLTFALYHYLKVVKRREVRMVGLDLKEDVVAFCGEVARDLGCEGLTFGVGDIAGYASDVPVDMVVTLHACDTATDDALVKAVAWNARVILSVPCCQHELFRQLTSDVLRPMLKHGILKERLTALVTDSVRASLLESAGYSVQILEFIALEHTAKNLLIRAVRRGGKAAPQPSSAEYAAFRDFWHIRPTMEAALAARTQEQRIEREAP
jgi:SAM-dependent methyltransferase